MNGRTYGGTSFYRGQLYNLLKNPIYIGRIQHRTKSYPGKHPAIIDQDTWDKVQTQLNDNTQGAQRGPTAKDPSLFAGKVLDQDGEPLVATHASKGKVRYRYYVSRHLQHGAAGGRAADRPHAVRLPARELEKVVLGTIVGMLQDPIVLAQQLGAPLSDPKHMASIISRSAALVARLDGKRGQPVQMLLNQILLAVTVLEDAVRLEFDPAGFGEALGLLMQREASAEMRITIPVRIRRLGRVMRFVLDNGQSATPSRVNDRFLAAMAQGRSWWKRLTANTTLTVAGLAAAEGLSPSYVDRILRLTFLAPDIVEALLDGTAPTVLTLDSMKDLKRIAPSWSDQRRLMGFAAQRS